MLDPHCHILPCVDDGPDSLEQSVAMACMAARDGIRDIICTPHVAPAPDNLDVLELWRRRTELQTALDREGIRIKLHTGAELMLVPGLMSFVSRFPELRLAGGRYFLFEINAFIPLEAVPPLLFSAKLAGFIPVFAHPERYMQVYEDIRQLEKIVSCGCLLQVTGSSLSGFFGKDVRACAESLCRFFPERIILGSDAHEARRRVPVLCRAFDALRKISRAACDHALAWGENFLNIH